MKLSRQLTLCLLLVTLNNLCGLALILYNAHNLDQLRALVRHLEMLQDQAARFTDARVVPLAARPGPPPLNPVAVPASPGPALGEAMPMVSPTPAAALSPRPFAP